MVLGILYNLCFFDHFHDKKSIQDGNPGHPGICYIEFLRAFHERKAIKEVKNKSAVLVSALKYAEVIDAHPGD